MKLYLKPWELFHEDSQNKLFCRKGLKDNIIYITITYHKKHKLFSLYEINSPAGGSSKKFKKLQQAKNCCDECNGTMHYGKEIVLLTKNQVEKVKALV